MVQKSTQRHEKTASLKLSRSSRQIKKNILLLFGCIFSHLFPTKISAKKSQEATGEKLSASFLFQSISMIIQPGKAVCVMGCQKIHLDGHV
jgi:hypothetical protein